MRERTQDNKKVLHADRLPSQIRDQGHRPAYETTGGKQNCKALFRTLLSKLGAQWSLGSSHPPYLGI